MKSIYVCKEMFFTGAGEVPRSPTVGKSDVSTVDSNEENEGVKADEDLSNSKVDDEISGSAADIKHRISLSELKSFFLPDNETISESKESQLFYMTPYSSVLFSHPVFVLGIRIIGVCVFVLAFLYTQAYSLVMYC